MCKIHSYFHRVFCVSVLGIGISLLGIIATSWAGEEHPGSDKTQPSFHYFTDMEYAYREVDLNLGRWNFNKADIKDFTVRFGIRHVPQFMWRLFPKFDGNGQLEYFFSATAEELRQENRSSSTSDIINTGVSPVIGLGLGSERFGPELFPSRIRLEARYGKYKKVSSSRRLGGNKYDVQADVSLLAFILDIELRYRLKHFEPFLAYNRYDFGLHERLVYAAPSIGKNGNYCDVAKNVHGLSVGAWINIKPNTILRIARHFINQNAYVAQAEMIF